MKSRGASRRRTQRLTQLLSRDAPQHRVTAGGSTLRRCRGRDEPQRFARLLMTSLSVPESDGHAPSQFCPGTVGNRSSRDHTRKTCLQKRGRRNGSGVQRSVRQTPASPRPALPMSLRAGDFEESFRPKYLFRQQADRSGTGSRDRPLRHQLEHRRQDGRLNVEIVSVCGRDFRMMQNVV